MLSRLPEAKICRVVACRESRNTFLRCRCREAKKVSRAQLCVLGTANIFFIDPEIPDILLPN